MINHSETHPHADGEKCCDGRDASEHRAESPEGKCCVDA